MATDVTLPVAGVIIDDEIEYYRLANATSVEY
jgi:hypothetical protein